MDEQTKLILAKYQVENIIELIKDNPYRQMLVTLIISTK